MILEHISFRKL